MSVNIAIDGPAGAGKSSIAKAVSKKLGYIYVDTGALYRTVGFAGISNNVNLDTEKEKLIALLKTIKVELKFINGEQRVFLNGNDVSEKIRLPEISMAASKVSAVPEVREFLFDLQKKMAEENNVLMDGRDIGTVVLPDADVKIYLTASAEERANRRVKQLEEKGESFSYDKILKEIKERDYNDMHREIAPLKQADDAVLVDSTEINEEETIAEIIRVIKERLEK